MGIVVIGDVFIDIKGYSIASYIPQGRNVGTIAQIHGGVGRNVAEDIANLELKPTFVGLVDNDAMGEDVIRKLERHKVDTRFMRRVPNGMGTWLAIFDNNGDVVASVSKRPDHTPVEYILDECGDEIFKDADSIAIEIDTDREIVKKTFAYAEKYNKKVYAMVSNMSIAVERRDFLKRTSCFVCNEQEAGILFSEDYSGTEPERMAEILAERVKSARIPRMIVTLGGKGAVYADQNGGAWRSFGNESGCGRYHRRGRCFFCRRMCRTYIRQNSQRSLRIGTRLSSTVICTSENICPRFMPEEFDLVL